MTQKALLTVPENWVLLWDSGQNVRMACPAPGCGTLHAYVIREDDKPPTAICRECGLNGIAAFQRAFNAYGKPKTARPTLTVEEMQA